MPVTIRVGLEEDGTGGVFGSIGCDGEGGGEVWEVENQFQQEEGLEGVEGGLAGGRPVPREVLLGEINEGLSDVGVVRNKVVVEVCETKERSDVFDFFGGRLTSDFI